MSCPTAFQLDLAVRFRPVPEQGYCLAYVRRPPALHRLNPASWMLAELADGRALAAIAADYAEAAGLTLDEAEPVAAQGLAELESLGIVARVLEPDHQGESA